LWRIKFLQSFSFTFELNKKKLQAEVVIPICFNNKQNNGNVYKQICLKINKKNELEIEFKRYF